MTKLSDYRFLARESLRGKWKVAVLAGFFASLLGAAASAMGNIDLNFSINSSNTELPLDNTTMNSLLDSWTPEMTSFLIGFFALCFLFGLVFTAAITILGGIIGTGYAKFNLDIVDWKPNPRVDTLFSYFHSCKTIAITSLLRWLYVMLWSFLCFIPGIIASYNYAMVWYIQAENPTMPAREALARSKVIMHGNRWRLFCLQCSFIGWGLLCILSCGIGILWLIPYQEASVAAFYRDITGTRPALEAPSPQPEYP